MKSPSTTSGFTLVELLVTVGLLSIVGLLGFMAMASSGQAMQVAETSGRVQNDLRETLMLMTEELQLAAKTGDDSLDPPLFPVEVKLNPVTGSPMELIFQTPTGNSGRKWTRRIRYRYMNEDTNNNAWLDAGEDLDGDLQLTRRFIRIQDINGDGDTTDPGETRPLGTANAISGAQFTINDGVVTVSLTASKKPSQTAVHAMEASVTGHIYLLN